MQLIRTNYLKITILSAVLMLTYAKASESILDTNTPLENILIAHNRLKNLNKQLYNLEGCVNTPQYQAASPEDRKELLKAFFVNRKRAIIVTSLRAAIITHVLLLVFILFLAGSFAFAFYLNGDGKTGIALGAPLLTVASIPIRALWSLGNWIWYPEKIYDVKEGIEVRYVQAKPQLPADYCTTIEGIFLDWWYHPMHTQNSAFIEGLLDTFNVAPKLPLKWDLKKIDKLLHNYHPKIKEEVIRILFDMLVNSYPMKEGKQEDRMMICFFGPPGCGKSHLAKGIAEALEIPFQSVSLECPSGDLFGVKAFKAGRISQAIIHANAKENSQHSLCIMDDGDRALNRQNINSSDYLALLDPIVPSYFDYYFTCYIKLPKFIIVTANYIINDPATKNRFSHIVDFTDPFTQDGKFRIAMEYLDVLIEKHQELPYAVSKLDFNNEDYKIMKEMIKKADHDKGARTAKNIVHAYFKQKLKERYDTTSYHKVA